MAKARVNSRRRARESKRGEVGGERRGGMGVSSPFPPERPRGDGELSEETAWIEQLTERVLRLQRALRDIREELSVIAPHDSEGAPKPTALPSQSSERRARRRSPDLAVCSDRRSPGASADADSGRPAVESRVRGRRPAHSAHASQTKRRRPHVMTPETQDRVLYYIAAGLSLRQAAVRVGCHHTTIIKLMQRDKDFAQRVAIAEEVGEARPPMRTVKASRKQADAEWERLSGRAKDLGVL